MEIKQRWGLLVHVQDFIPMTKKPGSGFSI